VAVPLTRSHLAATRRLLERRPLHNLYFLSTLDHYRSHPRTLERRAVVIPRGGRVVAAADCGRNLVLELEENGADDALVALATAAARIERGRHALVGPRDLIRRFQRLYSRRGASIREVRDQTLFAVGRDELREEESPGLRGPRPYELDELLRAHSGMCLEDLGRDQVAENPAAYREYFRRLIAEGRVWVVVEEGRVVFKAEAGVEAAAGAQVEGVYTDPARRRRGLARGALSCICRELLTRVPQVTLYVNDRNRPAIALYESLGFRRVGEWRTVLAWRD
jgi:ribosomal protein S18 acetylase RimI-like enzyme